MRFEFSNGSYAARVIFPRDNRILAKIDTGSPVTIMSLPELCDMLGINTKSVLDILRNFNKVPFTAYTGNGVQACPVYFRNVVVDNCAVDRFPVFVNTANVERNMLVGSDFISACDFVHNSSDKVIYVSKFNADEYWDNFKKQCRSTEPIEIFELVSGYTDSSDIITGDDSPEFRSKALSSLFAAAVGGLDYDRPIV